MKTSPPAAGQATQTAQAAASPAKNTAKDTAPQRSPRLSRSTPETGSKPTRKTLATAPKAMAVTAHPLATQTAINIMKKGGSAIDAAIAAQMVLNLVEPQSSGIGGGGFLLYWEACTRKLTTLDGREKAPLEARPDRFLDRNGQPLPFRKAVAGRRSVGTPGLLALLEKAHENYGRMPWPELFAPAIRLARQGFPVSVRMNKMLKWRGRDSFGPKARKYFFTREGKPFPPGHILKNPAFADTLELIARQGAKAQYQPGFIPAQDLVNTLWHHRENNVGFADLAAYKVKKRPPVCQTYHGYKVCSMGPPSSGGHVLAQTLGILNRYDLGSEAEKLAYADRKRYLGDPDFVKIPDGLLSPAYLAKRAMLVRKEKSMGKAVFGVPQAAASPVPGQDATRENKGTTHISIMDTAGNALSLTSSIEAAFGSGLMSGGYLLNNELTDFSFRPKDRQGRPVANRVEGGKRPRSSMSSTIVFNPQGDPVFVLGSPGGSRIPLYVLKGLLALIDWKMNAQEAARLINFGSRNKALEIENPGTPDSLPENLPRDKLITALRAMGHRIKTSHMTSGLHIIARTSTSLEGGADPRRDGMAGGF